MAASIKEKYSSINQSKISEQAKNALQLFRKATKNFTDKDEVNRISPKFEALYEKIKAQKPEAIKGYKAPAKAAAPTPAKAKAVRKAAVTLSVSAKKRFAEAKKKRSGQGLSTAKSDIEKDAVRPALPKGYRISKNGNKYWEGRENRIDRRPARYARLEDGGMMANGGGVSEKGAASIRITLRNGIISVHHGADKDKIYHWKAKQGDWNKIWECLYKLGGSMASGGMMAMGGMIEHGLEIGDTIFDADTDNELIYVENDGVDYEVNLQNGSRYRMGHSHERPNYASGGMMAKGGATFGKFGSGRINKNAWVSANYIGDSKVTLGDLQSYLERNTSEKFDKDKIYTITRTLFKTGDYSIDDKKDWKESIIYRKRKMASGGMMAHKLQESHRLEGGVE